MIIAVVSLITTISLTACAQTDVIGRVAETSFGEMLEAAGGQIETDEAAGGWSLSAPDGTARFIWSWDYSRSKVYDIAIEFDAAPFLAAGLDADKLPEGVLSGNRIMLGTELGDDVLTYDEEMTPLASFRQIIGLYREIIGYHEALDHYGVDVSGGNKFEWAKNIDSNDKDIVFVADPEIFINAGVNPEQVEGWVYAAVEMEDEKGKKVEMKKFLKPFNLE